MRPVNSTYRIQFTPAFGFAAAGAVIGYLAELGIGCVYASPVFAAVPGSAHGYDVTDQNAINPELGGEEGFETLSAAVRERDMGWLQDIVPNHMAFTGGNHLLMDVFEHGEDSAYRAFFDVDWDSTREGLRGRLLAPFLGKFFGESLESGEIRITYDRNGFTANYFGFSFPLKLASYPDIIMHGIRRLRTTLGRNNPDFLKLLGTLYVLQNLPSRENMADRRDQSAFVKQMLWELYSANGEFRTYLDGNLAEFNGEAGKPESFTLLDHLLSVQHYRFAFWKVATEEINYKRFFTINELIALRSELDVVFGVTHALILRLVREGKVTGLRVDHVDGLFDPGAYLRKLRERTGDIPVVVEKILGMEEKLPRSWPVQGTTGYDFLNHVNGVFCRTENERALDRIYAGFTGIREDYRALGYGKKKLIIETHMAGDIDNLAEAMKKVSSNSRHGYDITLSSLKRAIIEAMARFPVYRTYGGSGGERPEDTGYIRQAIREAAATNPDLAYELDFIGNFLLHAYGETAPGEDREQWIRVVARFEQFTVPLMAKGVEDTVLYNYNRLLSLNEVGGDPHRPGVTREEFHALNGREDRRSAMNATATHDTKRGEDIRARINVISEIPAEWDARVTAWKQMNAGVKKRVGWRDIPDGNEEYFLYQTLVGAFPFEEAEYPSFRDRIREYIRKSSREGKVHTAWLEPDTGYENAFLAFVDALIEPGEGNAFLGDFIPFQRRIAWYGMFNSLSQTLLKITSPGFPDFYQGTELWDLSLVDPDNRRPVDYEKRAGILRDIVSRENDIPALIPALFTTKENGAVKLFLIHRALRARNDHSDLFAEGEYLPLETSGANEERVIAFARKHGGSWMVVVVPRFLTDLVPEDTLPLGEAVWGNTRVKLPPEAPRSWTCAITGTPLGTDAEIPVGAAFAHFPGALLAGG